ncbi:hypothetical protein DPMN_122408 [Dreissena polymorpha]|uniref:Uncharacterized protein n=1 Tax=Dreissena polymorpha TaxID=45954 RepID=A0A9D4GPC3_DREPO|nr:hypothetical protein DPMN_122408 [Dreissena polymorpha]
MDRDSTRALENIVLHRESCLETCHYQASFRRLTVASRGSCRPTRVAVRFRT